MYSGLKMCEWHVHAGARTDNTERIRFLPIDLYMDCIKSPQDLNQTTVPFIQSYSTLKFDYKDTWAVIGCKIPDGERDGMRGLNYRVSYKVKNKSKCSSLKTESV